jgi:hypothetical protein
MSLNIKNPKAHELAERIASLTGETLTEAVTTALPLRLGTGFGSVLEKCPSQPRQQTITLPMTYLINSFVEVGRSVLLALLVR